MKMTKKWTRAEIESTMGLVMKHSLKKVAKAGNKLPINNSC